MAWDPDAIAPPSGDVYERERRSASFAGWLGAWLVGFAVAALLVWAQHLRAL